MLDITNVSVRVCTGLAQGCVLNHLQNVATNKTVCWNMHYIMFIMRVLGRDC